MRAPHTRFAPDQERGCAHLIVSDDTGSSARPANAGRDIMVRIRGSASPLAIQWKRKTLHFRNRTGRRNVFPPVEFYPAALARPDDFLVAAERIILARSSSERG